MYLTLVLPRPEPDGFCLLWLWRNKVSWPLWSRVRSTLQSRVRGGEAGMPYLSPWWTVAATTLRGLSRKTLSCCAAPRMISCQMDEIQQEVFLMLEV